MEKLYTSSALFRFESVTTFDIKKMNEAYYLKLNKKENSEHGGKDKEWTDECKLTSMRPWER